MTVFTDFLASKNDRARVERHFQAHDFVLDFLQRSPAYLREIPMDGGVYCIAGRRREEVLNVYVGKADKLQRRGWVA